MIGRLVGDLVDTQPFGDRIDSCVDVNGVGYRVSMTPSTLRELTGMPTAKVTVWVHTHVREDAMTLFGFASRDERSCFELLIGAHGVGPSLAMAILSTLPPTQLRQAVATDDVAALCRVSGVGKKTAQRLLLDLTSAFDAGSEFVDLTESIVTSSTVGSAPRSPEADVQTMRCSKRLLLRAQGLKQLIPARCCVRRCEHWPVRDERHSRRDFVANGNRRRHKY